MSGAIEFIIQNLRLIRLRDIIDIAIVAFIICKGVMLVKETRAVQLIKGIIILVIATQVANWMQLNAIGYLLSNTMQVGVLAIIIMFQPEIRRALEKMGTSTIAGNFFSTNDEITDVADAVCEASKYMSEHRIGALMLLERNTKLGDIMKSGTALDAQISPQLLINIFMSNTPLHDGATVIGGNKIKASACFLPLTQNNSFSKELGTRHRAAIGVSEIADCISVVVSEETGKISVAMNGELERNVNIEQLRNTIINIMGSDNEQKENSDAKQSLFEKIAHWMVERK